jgi:hypothetical protein
MVKYLSVAESYAIYEVQDDVFEVLAGGTLIQPPQIVLEVLALSGVAKKLGSIGVVENLNVENDDEDDEPPEGEGPWVE